MSSLSAIAKHEEKAFMFARGKNLRNAWIGILAFYACTLTMMAFSDLGPLNGLRELGKYRQKEELRTTLIEEKVVEPDKARYAYVFYLHSDASLHQMCSMVVQVTATVENIGARSDIDVVVMHTREMAEQIRVFLDNLPRVRFRRLSFPQFEGKHTLWESFAKMQGLASLDYSRVIFLSSNAMVKGKLDHLFSISPYTISVAAPRIYWLKQPMFTFEGPLVVDPPHPSMVQIQSGKMNSNWLYDRSMSEIEWINSYFLEEAYLFDSFYSISTNEFTPGTLHFRFWSKKFQETPEMVYNRTSILHFPTNHEPWTISVTDIASVGSTELRSFISDWYKAAQTCLQYSPS